MPKNYLRKATRIGSRMQRVGPTDGVTDAKSWAQNPTRL